MVRTARNAARRSTILVGLLLAFLGALLGIGIGHFLGGAFGRGFRVDWYLYRPAGSFDAYEVGLYAALSAALASAIMVLLAVGLAFRMRSSQHPASAGQARRAPRSRARHTWRAIAVYGTLLPLAIGVAVAILLTAAGMAAGIDGEDVALLSTGGALVAGAIGAYFGYVRTSRELMRGGIVLLPPGENIFARVALVCGSHARTTIIVLLLLTVVLGSGLGRLDTNVDVADVMPRGDPNTAAAKNLTSKFKSSFTLQVTFQLRVVDEATYEREAQRKLPFRRTEPAPQNISDELYVRAIDELMEFAKNYRRPSGAKSPFEASVSLPDLYRIINWTAAGGREAPPESFSLPPADSPEGAARFRMVHEGVWRAIPATADAVISRDGDQTAALITVRPDETMSGRDIGRWALEIRDAYVQWATDTDSAYKVFTGDNTPKFSVDLPIANAHSSDLAESDFKRLLPIIGAWILVTIFLAFRNASSIVIAFSALALGVVWTFGLMGYMNIPLNTLNLTVIPLIMGVGIDYGIHTLNEYQESRARGRSPEDAFRHLGGHAFFALFVATLNTVTGLAVMIISPSLLIAQLGILAVIAITASYLITITFIPAALRLNPRARAHEYRPSPLMGGIARVVSRYRVGAIILLVLITAILLPATQLVPIEAFGDPPRNWLKDDPLRREHEEAIRGFYSLKDDEVEDVKANILIFEGNINDPRAHRYMDAIDAQLRRYGENETMPATPFRDPSHECYGGVAGSRGRVVADTLRTLPFFVRTYLTVRDGLPGAGQYLLIERLAQFPGAPAQRPYPTTESGLRALLDEVQQTPLAGLGGLFYDHPDDEMAMMLFSVRAASFEDAREVWCQVQSVLAAPEIEALRPEGMHVSFFGNTAINYLFVAKELPWVGYMSIVSNTLVLAFVYIPTRLLRLTLLVGLLNFLAGVWWFAILPQFGVGQAITLTLPLVYIYAIGSDYGLHLALNAISLNNTEQAFRTTGKGVLFSGITTFGAFLIYTQMSNLAVQRTMIATAAAIPVIFLVTMLVVPVLYPVGKKFRKEHRALEAAGGTDLPEAPPDHEWTSPTEPVPASEPTQRARVRAVVVAPQKAVVRKKASRRRRRNA